MSDDGAQRAAASAGAGLFDRLPQRLRPLQAELPGLGQLRLVETTLLVILGLILASATIYDLSRQTRINARLGADLATWRHYTRHDYVNLSVDQLTLGVASEREVVCGNTRPGAPAAHTQVCLEIWGPIRHGLRAVHGGWYLQPHAVDLPKSRYGCFGPAAQGRCPG